MGKKIERQENKEVLGDKGTKEELNELKEDIIFHENENSDDGDNEHINTLDEELKDIIPISEIGEFDSEGHFNLREDIKGEDEIGSYILIKGQKYYDYKTRSKIDNFEGLGYHIHEDKSVLYLGKMNGMNLIKGTTYYNNGLICHGEYDDGNFIGKQIYPHHNIILIRSGNYENDILTNGTSKTFENGKLKHTYKGTFKTGPRHYGEGLILDTFYNGKGTMRWPDENNYTKMYSGEWENGKYNGIGKYEYSNGSIYKGERKNGKRNGKCEYYKLSNGDTYKYVQWENDKAKASEGELNYANGDTYEGYFLVNRNGMHVPFFKIKEEERPDNILEESGKDQIISTWKESNGRIHKFTITKGSIYEEGNGFITLYGDKLPNTHRDDERGNVMYHKQETSPTKEYDLTTWDYQINREFDGANYKFYYKKNEINNKRLPYNKGKVFSLPSSIGEKGAMHVANIMNKLIYEYKKHNRKYGFGAGNEGNLLWKNYAPDGVLNPPCAGGTGNSYSIQPYRNPKLGYPEQLSKTEINSSFGGETTDKIAAWLNSVVGK